MNSLGIGVGLVQSRRMGAGQPRALFVSQADANEGEQMVFSVEATEPMVVDVRTEDRSARSGQDYVAKTQQLVFAAPGEQEFTVETLNNGFYTRNLRLAVVAEQVGV